MELIMQFTTGLAKGFSAELIGKIVGYGIVGTLAFWLLKKSMPGIRTSSNTTKPQNHCPDASLREAGLLPIFK